MSYQLTNNWFAQSARQVWDQIIPQINPTRILEIGSFEGASACYLIDKLASHQDIELHCVDSWQGGEEHQTGGADQTSMHEVEKRFVHNTQLAMKNATNTADLVVHRGLSDLELPKLIAEGKSSYFDFIYIDGSHQAPDVLFDALLSFKLLKINGVMVFDDYLWQLPGTKGVDPIRCPKMAIDAFTTIHCRKLKIINAPLSQLYVQKTSD
jgi:hypothetical protein